MMRFRVALVALVGVSIVLACSSPTSSGSNSQPNPVSAAPHSTFVASPEAQPASQTPNASDSAFVDAAAADAFANMDAPALYIGIWDPQRGMIVRAYGNSVRNGAQATTQDSLRIASITKTFTSTLILELVQENKIDLDAPAATYLPTPLSGEPELKAISVLQLLAMQSGLADYLTDPNGIAGEIAANPGRSWTEQELVEAALKLDSAPPGTPGYSNTNFVLLGMIAEQVGGAPLSTLISERLTRPLGLRHTVLPAATDTSLPAQSAHGYLNQQCIDKVSAAGAPNIDPQTDTTSWNTSYFEGAGQMISTINDLGEWAATNFGTDMLNPDIAQERLQMHDIGGDGFKYGLGIKQFGDWYGHDGDAFGWDSLALYDPGNGVAFVAAVNSCTGFNDAFLDLLQTLYPDTATRS